jgi:uncharacterized membrane protein YfcA
VRAAIIASLIVVATNARAEESPYDKLQQGTFEYLAGVGASAITVPAMMAVGTAIGRSTNDLATALIPSLILQLAVPPVAVTLSEWSVGRFGLKDGSRFHPAIWVALSVNLIFVVVGSAAGVWTGDASSYAAFTVAESVLMPMAVTAVMVHKRRPQTRAEWATPPSVGNQVGVPAAALPLFTGRF